MVELEMLFSMFPNKGEISLQDENTSLTLSKYLNDTSEDLPCKMEYSIAIAVDEPQVRSSVHFGSVIFYLNNLAVFSFQD